LLAIRVPNRNEKQSGINNILLHWPGSHRVRDGLPAIRVPDRKGKTIRYRQYLVTLPSGHRAPGLGGDSRLQTGAENNQVSTISCYIRPTATQLSVPSAIHRFLQCGRPQ